jgi:hypothetical protein
LTTISGVLLIVLAIALFKKIGSAPSKSPPPLFFPGPLSVDGPVANRSVRWSSERYSARAGTDTLS